MTENSVNSNADLTADLVRDLIKERRSERRWKNIRFFLGFALVVAIAYALLVKSKPPVLPESDGNYVSLIRLDGMIAPGQGFSAEGVIPALKAAFKDQQSKGVILEINSGGGTPVQAAIIHDMILKLKKQYNKRVMVVGEDMLASGAYYVAVSADKIFVNANTITGSVGVIMKSFGVTDLMQKIGVQRRVYASGVDKDRLDPFLPETKEDMEKMQQLLTEVHDNFNQVVLQGRQGRLHADPSVLFTGDFWSGQTAVKLGLVDGLGNLYDVMESEFNVTRFKDYTDSGNPLKAFFSQMGSALHLPIGQERAGLWAKL